MVTRRHDVTTPERKYAMLRALALNAGAIKALLDRLLGEQ